MITAVSVTERKAAKRKLRKLIKNHGITMREIDARSPFHYNTVRDAFNSDTKYWNDNIINLALEMIEEKKLLITTK